MINKIKSIKILAIAAILLFVFAAESKSQVVILEMGNDTVCTVNDSVTVSIKATGFTNAAGFNFLIEYDRQKLSFGRTLNWDASFSGYNTIVDTLMGEISVMWVMSGIVPVSLADGSALFSLRFAAKGGISDIRFSTDAGLVSVIDTLALPMFVIGMDGMAGQYAPAPVITGNFKYCEGGFTNISTGSFLSYNWTGGTTTQQIQATAGYYSVTVTDASGCAGVSDSVKIIENLKPVPQVIGSLSYCPGDSATLQIDSAYQVMMWSDFSNENTVKVTANRNPVWVVIQDANGCVGQSPDFNVTPNTVLQPIIVGETNYCHGAYSTLNAGIYDSYLWSNSATTQTINATTGNYTVIVTSSTCTGVSPQLSITEQAAITGSQSFTECYGFSVTVGNHIYNTTGTYTDILAAANGCDSTLTTNLTIINPDTVVQVFTGCTGDYFVVGTDTLTQTGSFIHILTNQAGCDSIITTIISLYAPIVVNLGADDTVCVSTNDTLILDAGNYGMHFLWNNGDTTQTDTIFAANMTPGLYEYYVEVSYGGCTGYDTIKVLVDVCTGIEKLNRNVKMSVFPNPADKVINIESQENINRIEMFDITGKLCLTRNEANSKQVDISNLKKGLYFYKVWIKDKTVPVSGKIEVIK